MRNASLILVLALACATTAVAQKNDVAAGLPVDLTAGWDTLKVPRNPHKGWYHHYYDNRIDYYPVRNDSDLENFPGLNYLYIRLAWAYFEPREGKFDWSLIDHAVAKWAPKGYRFSLCITCKEPGGTNSTPAGSGYATPKWVADAGAKGTWVTNWGHLNWEPVWDDPVFLEKLAAFHAALNRRYGHQPWLVDVVTGSIGNWGEGHANTGHGSTGWLISPAMVKAHIDLYKKAYPSAPITINDDYLTWNKTPAEREELKQYVVAQGLAVRDDSVMVKYYVDTYPNTFSVQSPDLFEATYRQHPVTLETQLYELAKRDGGWLGPDGSQRGADMLRGAIRLMHATYIGYHGFADDWLRDNPDLARELANLAGYWYFIKSATLPAVPSHPGEPFKFSVEWLNQGVAPAYHQYQLQLKLDGPATLRFNIDDSRNRAWMEGASWPEHYEILLPANTEAGTYSLRVKLYDALDTRRDVDLGFKDNLRDPEGYYRLGKVRVKPVSKDSP